ncbi:MAG TPA: chemotaxis protein CheB [Cyclobacteriaceae bacterium]|nr:chemotaxis protein CheB [Cyclobacteriaceae bacterium]
MNDVNDESLEYECIVIGASAGGMNALSAILRALPDYFPLPLIIVQHRSRDYPDLLEKVLQHKSRLTVNQAEEKVKIEKGFVYIAPPDYHLMIERNRTFSLSMDEPVNYSRPSIDVLFESASEVYGKSLMGIILSGANRDGAAGMLTIHQNGGFTLAQDPKEAEYPYMPEASIQLGTVRHVMKLKEIENFLIKLS